MTAPARIIGSRVQNAVDLRREAAKTLANITPMANTIDHSCSQRMFLLKDA